MSAIKMDELLVSWLGSDTVYENVMELIEKYHRSSVVEEEKKESSDGTAPPKLQRGAIPPFYPWTVAGRVRRRVRNVQVSQRDTWDPLPELVSSVSSVSSSVSPNKNSNNVNPPLLLSLPKLDASGPGTAAGGAAGGGTAASPTGQAAPQQQAQQQAQAPTKPSICVRDQTRAIFNELGQVGHDKELCLLVESFVRITKDVCGFPSFFNIPLYARICQLWHEAKHGGTVAAPLLKKQVTFPMMEWYWKTHMEPFDPCDRFFYLVKQPDADAIGRDDFLPFIKALLQDHPGLEFLSSHAEFQEKYAVTVITRIFYCVNKCHSGRITARQVRHSDLLQAFTQVDEEEDINKVTRYFSYEHFYVLYCRFWELDQDRDYRITREDLLKYGDQSLSHMIVDRIFDAAPRPFEQQLVGAEQERPNHRDYLSYEDFIYFMLSEEDKANEVSVKYWFTCVDVDGDGKLNNMEMRSFYAVQLHRMQFMGHEIVPFKDMLCQMMDMIKPATTEFLVESDFLQPACRQLSGALFDALFNLNKYLLFEQRDPFMERQKREDEFDCDWDRFACMDYSRLAMEEEAREEAMEIDWVTADEEGEEDEEEDEEDEEDNLTDDDSESDLQGAMLSSNVSSSEAPF